MKRKEENAALLLNLVPADQPRPRLPQYPRKVVALERIPKNCILIVLEEIKAYVFCLNGLECHNFSWIYIGYLLLLFTTEGLSSL